MMTPVQFAQVLRMTESNGDPRAWGDADRAVTSYQVHPEWFWDQVQRYRLKPIAPITWDGWIEQYVWAFYATYQTDFKPVDVAMHFHLGHYTTADMPDWDRKYAARFLSFQVKQEGQSSGS